MPVIVVAPSDDLMEKTLSNMQEVAARGGKIILITDEEGARTVGHGVAETIVLPKVSSLRRADPRHYPGAAPRLPHRDLHGHRRRPAAQPRQECHG